MKGLYKFFWDCGRQGSLMSVFVAEDTEVAGIIGKQAYFGEVLGKHLEVYGGIEEKDIELLTQDSLAVEIVEKYNLETGYNPFDYLEEEQEDTEE